MVKTVQKLFSLVTICQNCHQKQSALFFFWLTVYIYSVLIYQVIATKAQRWYRSGSTVYSLTILGQQVTFFNIGTTTVGTGETGPPNFQVAGTNNELVPQLFGRSFSKSKKFHSKYCWLLSLHWWRHLVNAYEVKAGMVCLQCKNCVIHTGALQKASFLQRVAIQIQLSLPFTFMCVFQCGGIL